MEVEMKLRNVVLAAAAFAASFSVSAQDVKVAVAANFTAPIKEIAPLYEKATGDKLILSFGSTGAFFAQIKNGAPFEVLLAADDETPAKAVAQGLAVEGTSFTYAVGRLVMWSSDENFKAAPETLAGDAVKYVAIANPKVAPYGAAAYEALENLDLVDVVKPKVVQGDNIGKTYQFVKSGSAQAGFIALSQCWKNGEFTSGSGWVVPQDLYSPIRQDAVLLKKGEGSEAARRFLDFLKNDEQAAKIREAYGYGS